MEAVQMILTLLLIGLAVWLLVAVLLGQRSDKKPAYCRDLEEQLAVLRTKTDDLLTALREEMRINRDETNRQLERVQTLVREMQTLNAQNSDKITTAVRENLDKILQSNEKKLEQMRATVDEKLNETLTNRLNSSFKTVGEQLENVHKSLGEMKELASGVSDLQRVLTNVKARGTWAEVQLGNLLEQTLTAEQYERNVSPKGDRNRVEYAVKIPSREQEGAFVWLPIDSKFPQEDYLRLSEAADKADKDAVEAAAKALERAVKEEAKTISSLYINVPQTTDFAILFLPTEGLYAEVLRRPGLCEEIQTNYRVMICGPTTLTAFLNTLRMGFRTIALDKRAAEVWKILSAAKGQYEKFEVVLAKAKKKIEEAGSSLDDATKRNDIIHRKLKGVESIAPAEADQMLGLPQAEADEE